MNIMSCNCGATWINFIWCKELKIFQIMESEDYSSQHSSFGSCFWAVLVTIDSYNCLNIYFIILKYFRQEICQKVWSFWRDIPMISDQSMISNYYCSLGINFSVDGCLLLFWNLSSLDRTLVLFFWEITFRIDLIRATPFFGVLFGDHELKLRLLLRRMLIM